MEVNVSPEYQIFFLKEVRARLNIQSGQKRQNFLKVGSDSLYGCPRTGIHPVPTFKMCYSELKVYPERHIPF